MKELRSEAARRDAEAKTLEKAKKIKGLPINNLSDFAPCL